MPLGPPDICWPSFGIDPENLEKLLWYNEQVRSLTCMNPILPQNNEQKRLRFKGL
jgi:hypothetical protein